MSWQTVSFESLYAVPSRNGISVAKNQHDGETKIVNMGELFASDFIGDIPMRRIKVENNQLAANALDVGDLLFARRSLVASGAGKVSMVSDLKEPTVFESSIIRVRLDQAKALPRFYAYWFRSPGGIDAISRLVTGTNVKGIRGSELRSVRVPAPALDEQRRIASILMAYDNLIENNRRQIALLEEAAQRLYKEWFVDLRFPGHEDAEIIDGVPTGWTKTKLERYAPFKRGKTITAKQAKPGSIPVVAGGLEPAYFHSMANARGPVVTVSGSGANAGYTRLYHQSIWASDCSYVCADDTSFLYFVYLTVKVLGRDFKHLQRGSAQPHVYPTHINDLDILKPSEPVLKRFNYLVSQFYESAKTAERQIACLRESRDRLLPKLMSGAMGVAK